MAAARSLPRWAPLFTLAARPQVPYCPPQWADHLEAGSLYAVLHDESLLELISNYLGEVPQFLAMVAALERTNALLMRDLHRHAELSYIRASMDTICRDTLTASNRQAHGNDGSAIAAIRAQLYHASEALRRLPLNSVETVSLVGMSTMHRLLEEARRVQGHAHTVPLGWVLRVLELTLASGPIEFFGALLSQPTQRHMHTVNVLITLQNVLLLAEDQVMHSIATAAALFVAQEHAARDPAWQLHHLLLANRATLRQLLACLRRSHLGAEYGRRAQWLRPRLPGDALRRTRSSSAAKAAFAAAIMWQHDLAPSARPETEDARLDAQAALAPLVFHIAASLATDSTGHLEYPVVSSAAKALRQSLLDRDYAALRPVLHHTLPMPGTLDAHYSAAMAHIRSLPASVGIPGACELADELALHLWMYMEQAVFHTRLGCALDVHPMPRSLGERSAEPYSQHSLLPWSCTDTRCPALLACAQAQSAPALRLGEGDLSDDTALYLVIGEHGLVAQAALRLLRQGVRLADPSMALVAGLLRILREDAAVGMPVWDRLSTRTCELPTAAVVRIGQEAALLFTTDNNFQPYYQDLHYRNTLEDSSPLRRRQLDTA